MYSMTIDSAAIRLTDTILGDDGPDLEQTLKAIAANIGVLHIAYAPLCSQKSEDANLLSAICTYPVAWQARYFKKQYARIDPRIRFSLSRSRSNRPSAGSETDWRRRRYSNGPPQAINAKQWRCGCTSPHTLETWSIEVPVRASSNR
jgi:hypothetical protein